MKRKSIVVLNILICLGGFVFISEFALALDFSELTKFSQILIVNVSNGLSPTFIPPDLVKDKDELAKLSLKENLKFSFEKVKNSILLIDITDKRYIIGVAIGVVISALIASLIDTVKLLFKKTFQIFGLFFGGIFSFMNISYYWKIKKYTVKALNQYKNIAPANSSLELELTIDNMYISLSVNVNHTPLQERSPGFKDNLKIVPGLKVLREIDRILLLGNPGSGKTTFLKNVIVCTLKKELENWDFFPIYISLSEFADKADNTKLNSFVISKVTEMGFSNCNKYINQKYHNNEIIALLDGLDEVKEDDLDNVVKRINEYCKDKKNKVLLSCREQVFSNKRINVIDFKKAMILEFDNEGIKSFLTKWPAYPRGKNALVLIDALDENPSIKDICRTPLMLTILAELYSTKKRFELPDSVHDFFDDIIEELFFRREDKFIKELKNMRRKRKRDILSKFAFFLLKDKERKGSIVEFYYDDFTNFCTSRSEKLGILKETVEFYVDDIKNNVGIIHEINKNHLMAFRHRLFLEFLAASEVFLRYKGDWSEVYTLYIEDRNTWYQVLIFYSNRLGEEVNDLLKKINSSNDSRDILLAGKIMQSSESVAPRIADNIIDRLKSKIINI